jgi:ATP-dependent DNA helicase RecQ
MMNESIRPHLLPERILVERFDISSGFHPGQQEIIGLLLQGKRILAIQRTGWGKSLCYQLASLYYPHLTIVFSPLKALMRDQCQRCNDGYRIPSAIVSSDFTETQNNVVLEQAINGQLKLLFIAPERLNNALWQRYVHKMSLSMIVIDEAHCISTWGHDFRPQYRRIVELLNVLPQNTPVLALTATANKRVEADILEQMGTEVVVVRGTMCRPNLHIKVLHLQGNHEKLHYLGQLLPSLPGTGIIYTATQRDAEVVAAFLAYRGFSAEYYHAGREDDVRREVEEKLMSNACKVVCSTNALGMGIDKRDLRFIIHYHVPASPIHYYQEIGRAGRDGNISQCILFYDPVDLEIHAHFIRTAKPSADNDAIQACKLQELDAMRNYAYYGGCYMGYLTAYLGDRPGSSCCVCSNCWPANFPFVQPSERMSTLVTRFLERKYPSRGEKGSLAS